MGRSLNEISVNALETVQRYGIDRAGHMSAPADHEVHHLVEKRFFAQLGFESAGQAKYNILGVIVDTETHRLAQDSITQKLREAIGYGRGLGQTRDATLQAIWNAHRDVYESIGRQDWAELIWEVYFQNSSGVVK